MTTMGKESSNASVRPLEGADHPTRESKRMPFGIASPMVKRQALVVLGMHRSGTSALTRVLNLLGADLPGNLMPPVPGNNETGFWESRDVANLNDEILSIGGFAWDDFSELSSSWRDSVEVRALQPRILAVLERHFEDSSLFVLKDPRICRLVPLWLSALREFEAEPCCVIPIRNPLEVAASLKARDGFLPTKSLLLWLRYLLDAERDTRGTKRIVISYESILRDWQTAARRIARELEITWPRFSHERVVDVERFLSEGHHHHHYAHDDLLVREDVAAWVTQAYFLASSMEGSEDSADKATEFDKLREQLEVADRAYGPVLAELRKEASSMDLEIRQMSADLTAREEQIQQLTAGSETQARELSAREGLLASQRVELETLRSESERYAQQLRERQAQVEQLNAELGARREELARLSSEAGHQTQELAERDGTIERLTDEIERLTDEIGARQASTELVLAEINGRLEAASARDRELDEAIGALEGKLSILREEVDEQSAATRALETPEARVKLLAFFLPQYHPIGENDAWWGLGFTEWANVTRGTALFAGHRQPYLPSDLGFYDLRVLETRQQQAEMAREYGIHGFCYYYYWFQGQKLLERPLEDMLASGEPDFPFCLCWANENWTRRWDGEDQEILIAQEHSPEGDARFIDDVMPALLDPRYIQCDGKPVLLVYRADLLADPVATTGAWRQKARAAGFPDLHLCAVWRVEDPRPLGFDALVEFPPHHFPHRKMTHEVDELSPDFEGEILDYAAGVDGVQPLADPGFPVHRGVMPRWDNTARRGPRAHIFAGSTPEKYAEWLEKVVRESAGRPGQGDQFVFLNAWNEWAEGAVLEPSRAHGRRYLEATRTAYLAGLNPGAGLNRLERRLTERIDSSVRSLESVLAQHRAIQQSQEDQFASIRSILDSQQTGLEWSRDSLKNLTATAREHESALSWLRATADDQAAEIDGQSFRVAGIATQVDSLQDLSREVGELRGLATSVELLSDATQRTVGDVDRRLSSRLEELEYLEARRLALQARPPSRELWLGLHFGWLGCLLRLPLWLLQFRLGSRWRWWAQGRQILRTGLFEPDYYARRYPEVVGSGIDPLYHYVRYGAREGRNPSLHFNGKRYLERYPELVSSDENPLLHALTREGFGAFHREMSEDETSSGEDGRSTPALHADVSEPAPEPAKRREAWHWSLNSQQLAKRADPGVVRVLFLVSEAVRGEAQEYLLGLLEVLSATPDLELCLLLAKGGELRPEFERHASVLMLDTPATGGGPGGSVARDAVQALGEVPDVLICQGGEATSLARELNDMDIPLATFLFDTAEEASADLLALSRKVLVPTESLRRSLSATGLSEERVVVLPPGIVEPDQPVPEEALEKTRRRICRHHGLPLDARLILGSGAIRPRQGADLFVQVARKVAFDHHVEEACFLWLSSGAIDPDFLRCCEHDLGALGLENRVFFLGNAGRADYYAAASLYLATAQKEHFPLAGLEAMAHGVPVVAFEQAGAWEDALSGEAGILVPYTDTEEMARAAVRVLEAPRYEAQVRQRARSRIREAYSRDRVATELSVLARQLAATAHRR